MNWLEKIKENLLKTKFPPLKDILYLVMILFSITFGVLTYALGEKIKQSCYIEKIKPPSALESKINSLVSDFPIKRMVPYIAQKNSKTAAYLVAIAKKESNWGKYSPKKSGGTATIIGVTAEMKTRRFPDTAVLNPRGKL